MNDGLTNFYHLYNSNIFFIFLAERKSYSSFTTMFTFFFLATFRSGVNYSSIKVKKLFWLQVGSSIGALKRSHFSIFSSFLKRTKWLSLVITEIFYTFRRINKITNTIIFIVKIHITIILHRNSAENCFIRMQWFVIAFKCE